MCSGIDFFFSSRRRHTRWTGDWSSDVCSSDLRFHLRLLAEDGRTLYTWCAWDSLFIPVILGEEAEVESPAPGSTVHVRLRVSPRGVQRVQPPSAVMSFLLPSAETFQADALKAMAAFCHFIFFFPDSHSAAGWTKSHPDTTVISMSDAFELGRRMVSARWR